MTRAKRDHTLITPDESRQQTRGDIEPPQVEQTSASGEIGPLGALGPGGDRDPATGRFVRGNVAAFVTGRRSMQFWRAADGERRTMRAALLQARGFSETDAPPGLAEVADGAAQAVLIRNSAFHKMIEAGGPTTTHDKRRDVLRIWESSSASALKHLQAIGLDRVPKPAEDIHSYLQRRYGTPENRPDTEAGGNGDGDASVSLDAAAGTPDGACE